MNCKNNIPRPEHPRPDWERRNWRNLNGEWMFEIDPSASGEERGLQDANTLSSRIVVPFCPESELSGVGHKDFMSCVWYKKTVNITEEELSFGHVIFHIGAADFETKVWVNGASAGLSHLGGFVSFEYDITSLLTVGENVITVCCYDDTRAGRQAGGKQSLRYRSYGCFYTRTTGIWQTVWLELVPTAYVKYARITPDAENATVQVSAELCGRGDFSAEVYYKGRKVGEGRKSNRAVTAELEIALSEKHLWDIGCGELYDLVLRFGEDEVRSYFGLRQVELRDGRFCLNGRPVFQRLVLDQGFYADGIWTAPTEEALLRDIRCSMSAGFNGARLHEKVFEPRFLYHCDREGYMVWGEYGNWGFDHSTTEHLHIYLSDFLASVRRDYNHPAIIGWCPFNETWDYTDENGQVREQNNDVLRYTYEVTKAFDPTRLCIDTSGNFHVVTDIYDVHDYNQDPVTFKENYDKLATDNELYDRVLIKHPKRQCWRGEPVFISEYGGIGFCLAEGDVTQETAWSYGTSTHSYEEFYARYQGLAHAILDNPRILGFCYTQLTDVEQEQNGLFTYRDRKPKFDLKIISEINRKKAAIEE